MADLSAFLGLDELAGRGVLTVKVAVRSAETPDELESRADIVVEWPAGLVKLTRAVSAVVPAVPKVMSKVLAADPAAVLVISNCHLKKVPIRSLPVGTAIAEPVM